MDSRRSVAAQGSTCDGAGLPSNLRSYLSKYISKVFRTLDFSGGHPQVDEDGVNPIVLY